MNKTYYIGLDVHKEKAAIAYAQAGSRDEATYHGKCAASVQNVERTLRKLAKKLGVEFRDLLDALMAFKGFKQVAAMITTSELGDLTRFAHPRKLMGFLGMVSDEESSGTRRRQGAI